jgi:hypothetical protein
MKTRRRRPKTTTLPCRLQALRAALAQADTDDRRAALAAAVQEEAAARLPLPGRLVRVSPENAREAKIPAGTYRVKAADAPEFGISVLDLVPPDRPDAKPVLVADHYAVALRVCPRCRAAGLSEELAWDAARGICGVCCDRDDGADEWVPY